MLEILRTFLYFRVIDISRPVLVLRMSLFAKIENIDFFRNWLSDLYLKLKIFKWLKMFLYIYKDSIENKM